MTFRKGHDERIAQATAQSRAAGLTLGNMLFLNNPGWSEEQLAIFMATLNPKPPMLKTIYLQSVYDGFYRARERKLLQTYGKYEFGDSGNMLPPEGEQEHGRSQPHQEYQNRTEQ